MFDMNDKKPFHHGVGGLYPPEKPRFTLSEDMMHTINEMRMTIDRMVKFEQRVENEVHDLMSKLTSDNCLFKDTFANAHTLFTQEIKNEVNLFEQNLDNTIKMFVEEMKGDYDNLNKETQSQHEENLKEYEGKLKEAEAEMEELLNAYKKKIESMIESDSLNQAEASADFQRKLSSELNMFEADMNQRFRDFTNTITTATDTFKETWASSVDYRLDAQDRKLANAEVYMKTNLEATVRTELGDMYDSGDFAEILEGEVFNDIQDKMDKIEDNVNQTINDFSYQTDQKLEEIGERMDNLVIEGTPTEGNAELIDMRLGADGTTYTSAGEAVRTQLENVGTDLNAIASHSGVDVTLVQGGSRTDTGEDYESEYFVRTNYLPRNISRVTCNSGYIFAVLVDANEAYLGRVCTDGSIEPSSATTETSEKQILYTNNFDFDKLKHNIDYRFVIQIKKVNGDTITPEEAYENVHFIQNDKMGYSETFYMDRMGLTDKSNISITMSNFSVNDFYRKWHTKEMIYVSGGSTIKVECDTASLIRIFQINNTNNVHTITPAASGEEVTLSPNCRWVRIEATCLDNRTLLKMPVTVSWVTSEYEILDKQRDLGTNTVNFVYPVPDVHGMLDTSEGDDVQQFTREIGYTSGMLMLPPNYRQTGQPVDVIVFCHSSGSYFNFNDSQFASSYLPYLRYLRDEGYMVVDFWGHSSFAPVTATRPRTYGNPDNMACYAWGIKYILDNFNVNPNGVFISGKSLGGEVGLNLAFNTTGIKPAAVGMLAPAFNLLRRSLGYTKEERFENAWAWGFEGDTEAILGDETTAADYGTIPAETDEYKAYIKANASKLIGFNPMWNGLIGADLDTLCDWSFELGEGDQNTTNWTALSRHCNTPIKIWDAVDDANTPYSIAKNFVDTLKKGGCMAELRTMPTGTGGHYSVDIGTTANPSVKVSEITTRTGVTHTNIPLAYVELVNYFRRFTA